MVYLYSIIKLRKMFKKKCKFPKVGQISGNTFSHAGETLTRNYCLAKDA